MRARPPLEIDIPVFWTHTRKESDSIPPGQTPILPFTHSHLIQWGNHSENYILQQVYTNAGVTIVHLSFSIAQYCILPIYCREAFNALQYTLRGFTFARLHGYGVFPLFEGTYSLQYIPVGIHKVLMPPGKYHFLYILPGPNLALLTEKHPNIKLLIEDLEALHENGDLAIRLPIDTTVSEIINQLQSMSTNEEVEFSLSSFLIKLLRQVYRQLQKKITEVQPTHRELPSYISHFIATRIHEPVPDLVGKIKDRFFLEGNALRKSWSPDSNIDLPPSPIRSPRAILNAIRLKLALFLLVIEHLPVTKVSDMLSYASIYSFSDHFKSNFGFSPAQAQGNVF